MKPIINLEPPIILNDWPMSKFVKLILYHVICDHAFSVKFELVSKHPPAVSEKAAEQFGCESIGTPQPEGDHEIIDFGFRSLPAGGSGQSARSSTGKFRISYAGDYPQHDMAPPPRYLYEPCIRVLLNHTRHPYWRPGPIEAEIWTENPRHTFVLRATDWRKSVTLERVEERHEFAGEPGDDDTLLPPVEPEPTCRFALTCHQLPELAHRPLRERGRVWREFCQQKRMRWRLVSRTLGAVVVAISSWMASSLLVAVLRELELPNGIFNATALALTFTFIAFVQNAHLQSWRPLLRDHLANPPPPADSPANSKHA